MRDFTEPVHSGSKIPNPFVDDVFVPASTPLPGTTEVHQKAMAQCVSILEDLIGDANRAAHWGNTGRTILISSPRAGYGKTHLVGRLCASTESIISAVDLSFSPARKISWQSVLASFIRQYRITRCPQQSNCSLLEETSRFFLSLLLQANIKSGALDEKDSPESLVALRMEYRDLFNRKSKSKALAWVDKKAGDLARHGSSELQRILNLGAAEVVFWTNLFVDCAQEYDDAVEPLRKLSDGEARERTLQLMRIASECRPIAFVVDHLDGFHGSPEAGMAIAEVLTDIGGRIPSSLVLLCLNDDVWESTFAGNIPSAWMDRLVGEQTKLGSIPSGAARAMTTDRLLEIGVSRRNAEDFVDDLAEDNQWHDDDVALFPRDVIRQARKLWEKSARRYYTPPHLATANENGHSSLLENRPAQTETQIPFGQQQVPPPSTGFAPPARLVGEPANQLPPTEPESPAPSPSESTNHDSPEPDPAPAAPERVPQTNSAGIESIIDDIRGSGNSVVSQNGQAQSNGAADHAPNPEEVGQMVNPEEIHGNGNGHSNGNGNGNGAAQPSPTPEPLENFAPQQGYFANQQNGAPSEPAAEPPLQAGPLQVQRTPAKAPSPGNDGGGTPAPFSNTPLPAFGGVFADPYSANDQNQVPAAQLPPPPAEAVPSPQSHPQAMNQTATSPMPLFLPQQAEEVFEQPKETPPQGGAVPLLPSDDLEQVIVERENDLAQYSQNLQLDLQRIERLIQAIGKHHPALRQVEEQFTSSRSICLRWQVRDQSVLIGFDPPRNVYFWNSLLQQSLNVEGGEKITAFSHRSQPFDPGLFSSFGFSKDVVDSRIDIVEMNDKELAMIYAAESLIEEATLIGRGPQAIEIITRRLDPLWRRISRPLVIKRS